MYKIVWLIPVVVLFTTHSQGSSLGELESRAKFRVILNKYGLVQAAAADGQKKNFSEMNQGDINVLIEMLNDKEDDIDSLKRYCVRTEANSKGFKLKVPLGRYYVFASEQKRVFLDRYTIHLLHAYYSECDPAVAGGCRSHEPIPVPLRKNGLKKINPIDWYVMDWFLDLENAK